MLQSLQHKHKMSTQNGEQRKKKHEQQTKHKNSGIK